MIRKALEFVLSNKFFTRNELGDYLGYNYHETSDNSKLSNVIGKLRRQGYIEDNCYYKSNKND